MSPFIKRMASRIGTHLNTSRQTEPSSLPSPNSLPSSPSAFSHSDYRGSISTEATSFASTSEWGAAKYGNVIEIPNLSVSIPSPAKRQVARPQGKYHLSDFIIQRTLGTGSFGRVHLVRSKHNLNFYAIKVLNKEKVVRSKQQEHTNNERMMLLMVQHPFIVNLWGSFQDTTNLYMVMDFVPGGELFALLRKSNRFPDPVAKFYAAEVALAFNYLHSHNIVYRDLKPENVLIGHDGHIKVADFGFAKECDLVVWTLCGTPDYLAPEIISAGRYNKSVDWYALGVLIFEMLCGQPPYHEAAGNHQVLYQRIIDGPLKHVRWPPISDLATDIILKLMEGDPTKRYGNLWNGSGDVFAHPWFREVDWEKLSKKGITAPYLPKISGMGDASAFEYYPAEDQAALLYGHENSEDSLGYLFPDFDYTSPSVNHIDLNPSLVQQSHAQFFSSSVV